MFAKTPISPFGNRFIFITYIIMRKLILFLLFLVPFTTFASNIEDIKNIELKIKNKTINGLVLYNKLENVIDKKSKWSMDKKLNYYSKLIKITDKKDNDTFKKLNLILKYWKNKLENKNKYIDSKYSYEEQLNFYPFYTKNLWDKYWDNPKFVKRELESIYKRLNKWKNQYNNLVYDILVDDYNLVLSIYKDWWALNPILDWTDFKNRLKENSCLIKNNCYFKSSKKFADSWYKVENWVLIYDKSLNTFNNEIKAYYINDNIKNWWGLVFEKVINKSKYVSWSEYKKELEDKESEKYLNSKNNRDWIAFYWNWWEVSWHWNFSDKEIKEYWNWKYNQLSAYEKMKNSMYFFANWERHDYYDIDLVKGNIERRYNLINDSKLIWIKLMHDELVEDYNLYLSIYKNWWLLNEHFNWSNINETIIKHYNSNYDTELKKVLSDLWYRYENWKLIYKDELNIMKKEFENFKEIK